LKSIAYLTADNAALFEDQLQTMYGAPPPPPPPLTHAAAAWVPRVGAGLALAAAAGGLSAFSARVSLALAS
tara:strand:+ start:73 stop:285 length:213 start_codon:yes stop_codon:yes gene_type:complete